jgi:hypothetical protein
MSKAKKYIENRFKIPPHYEDRTDAQHPLSHNIQLTEITGENNGAKE